MKYTYEGTTNRLFKQGVDYRMKYICKYDKYVCVDNLMVLDEPIVDKLFESSDETDTNKVKRSSRYHNSRRFCDRRYSHYHKIS